MSRNMNKILVLKLGTNTLVQQNGSEQLDTLVFSRLASQIIEHKKQGYNIVIVSSGAITAGMMQTRVTKRPETMLELQRLAGIGWPLVVTQWSNALKGETVFSALLTRQELGRAQPTRREAINVINAALTSGDIVLVNENDVITHEEIQFGDNDTLAATLAVELKESNESTEVVLMLLSDVNGLRVDKDDPSTVIRVVERLEDVAMLAHDSHSNVARGGMITKLRAAQIASESGIATYVTDGRADHTIARTLQQEIGTCFRLQ